MATLVDLSKWLEDLATKIEPLQSEMQELGEAQAVRIQDRTALGVSVDLQPFTNYAPATNKPSPVNLRKTGDMLEAVTVESDHTAAHIFFNDPEQAQIAKFHNDGTQHIPQRFFFGVSLDDKDKMVGDLRASIFRRINK